jgi:Arc/MetJ family transcription regulator
MGKLVADIIAETLQNVGVKHCYGVVGDMLNLIAWNDGQRHAVSDLHGREATSRKW